MFNPFLGDAECNIVDNEVIIDKEREKMIAWAAGLYEGEGTTTKQVPIMITQKDTWILYKLQELFGGRIAPKTKEKLIFRWYLCGPDGRDLLKLFLPYLSPRRIKQIEDNGTLNIIRGHNTCNNGHKLTGTNTKLSSRGFRVCRICNEKYHRLRQLSLRKAINATI